MTFIFLLFLKLFAGTVHLCQGTVVTRVPMRLSRNSSLKHWRLAHFRGVNCLCRTRVVKKQLLAATVFANRARREGLPGVYLAKASGEPSIAKENNYPFAVRISCGTHTIKINIGSPRPHLCFAFMRAIKQYIIFSPKMIKRELSFLSNQFVFTFSATFKIRIKRYLTHKMDHEWNKTRNAMKWSNQLKIPNLHKYFFQSDTLSLNA